MKKITFTLILSFFISTIQAQQLPIFTQYREMHGFINPATINSDYFMYEYNMYIGASARTQWIGFEDGPKTQLLKGEYLFTGSNTVGLLAGGYIINDQTDPFGMTGVYGRLAGIVTDDPYYGGFSLGLSFGAVQHRVNTIGLNPRERDDQISRSNLTQVVPDVGFGLYFYRQVDGGWFDGDNIYAGVSVPQILGLEYSLKDENGEYAVKRTQHYYALLGFYKYLGRENTFIEPSVWFRYVPGAPVNLDFNLRYQLSNNFWVGTGFSTARTFHLELGLLIGENLGWDRNFKIGYGFDSYFTTFGPSFGASHEINFAVTIDTGY